MLHGARIHRDPGHSTLSTAVDRSLVRACAGVAHAAAMYRWSLATAVAQRQHMHLARWQVRLLGISDTAIQTRVREQGWQRPHPGVLALPAPEEPCGRLAATLLRYSRPTDAVSRLRRQLEECRDPVTALVAAAMEAGQVLCGPSAAWLHGLLSTQPETIWIRLPDGHPRTQSRGVHLRYGVTQAHEWMYLRGLPVTTVGLTIRDLAGLRTAAARRRRLLRRVIAQSDALRLTTVEKLHAEAAAAGSFRGRPLLEDVLAELRGELTHSEAERRARRHAQAILSAHGVAVHPRPYPIRHRGRLVAEADLAIVALRYDIEVDGPHHMLPAQQAKDRQRDRAVRAAGWTVDRFTVDEIDADPATFAAAIDAVVTRLRAVPVDR